MQCQAALKYSFTGSVIISLLAGCSGGGGSSLPAPRSLDAVDSAIRPATSSTRQIDMPSVFRAGITRVNAPDLLPGFVDAQAVAKKGAVVIASDSGTGDVAVYTLTGKLIAKLTGLSSPAGVAADKAGDVYFAETGTSSIPLYKNDYKTRLATLQDPGQYPVGVGYDSTSGNVGVTNIFTTAGGAGSVTIYAKGAVTACATVTGSSFAKVYFGAFDDAGNFYVDGVDSSGTTVVGVVKGGCQAETIAALAVSNAIGFPGGVQVTPSDQIAIGDQNNAAIYTYNLPKHNVLGNPVVTTTLQGASDPVAFSFTTLANYLWTADAGNSVVSRYAYPAGGSPVQSLSGFSQPVGVIVTPGETP